SQVVDRAERVALRDVKLRVIVRAQLEAEAVDALDMQIAAAGHRRLLGGRRLRPGEPRQQRVRGLGAPDRQAERAALNQQRRPLGGGADPRPRWRGYGETDAA